MKLLPIIALYAVISGAGAGCARTPASTAGIAGPKPIVTPAAKPTLLHKAKISKVCSEQADAKNLPPWKGTKNIPCGMHAKRRQFILTRTRAAGRF